MLWRACCLAEVDWFPGFPPCVCGSVTLLCWVNPWAGGPCVSQHLGAGGQHQPQPRGCPGRELALHSLACIWLLMHFPFWQLQAERGRRGGRKTHDIAVMRNTMHQCPAAGEGGVQVQRCQRCCSAPLEVIRHARLFSSCIVRLVKTLASAQVGSSPLYLQCSPAESHGQASLPVLQGGIKVLESILLLYGHSSL